MAKSKYADKEIATNLLVTLKHMKAELNLFTQEASNEELFQEINQVYTQISGVQREVFQMMCAQGWYKMKSDTKDSIAKAYKKFSDSESDLCEGE